MGNKTLGNITEWAGWTPVPAIADRGADKVMVIADFVGGVNNKPTSEIGKYVGVDGLVVDIEDAVALPKGATGEKPKMNSTSITSNVIGTGAKTFTLATPLDMVVGEVVKAYSLADPSNYVCGYIFSITPTELVITVSEVGGSGTKTDWVIVSSAFRGPIGLSTTNMVTANRLLGKGAGQTVPSSPSELEPVGFTVDATKIYNGTSISGTAALNSAPSGGIWYGGGSATGAIEIKLPTTITMFSFRGVIFFRDTNAGTNRSCEFLISAYPNDMETGNSAVFLGTNAIKFPVRWHVDGADKYVYIGDLTQTWNYSSFTTQGIIGTFNSPTLANISSGWATNIVTAFKGTQSAIKTETLPRPSLAYAVGEFNAASGLDIPLTNAMSPLQMFQNLDKSRDNRYTKAESNTKFLPSTLYGTSNGCLITTSILAGTSIMFQLEMLVHDYSNNKLPTKILLSAYNNSGGNVFANLKATSLGEVNPAIEAFISGGVVCFWFPTLGTGATIHARVFTQTANGGNVITSITNVARPAGTTRDSSITPIRTLLNNGLSTNVLLADGTPKPVSDFILATQKGAANGIVPLNASSLIDQTYLPSYVDDIIEGYKSGANFYKEVGLTTLITGETGKIYVDLTTGQNSKQYRWSGSAYIQITNGLIANTNDVAEGSNNLYFTVARVLATVISGFSASAGVVANTDTIIQAINKIVGNIAALQTAIDAKVADNLTASTTVAPSKTAVNTALALKADIAAATGTLVALTFTSDSVQGTIASPLTGNITGNITGAKLGVVTLVIHNHTTAPTFDSKYKKLSGSGSYVTGSVNYIFCEYINDTEIIYSINQRT